MQVLVLLLFGPSDARLRVQRVTTEPEGDDLVLADLLLRLRRENRGRRVVLVALEVEGVSALVLGHDVAVRR